MRVHVPAHTPRSLNARAGRAKAARSATSASRPARAEEYTPPRRTAHPVWPLTLSVSEPSLLDSTLVEGRLGAYSESRGARFERTGAMQSRIEHKTTNGPLDRHEGPRLYGNRNQQ